VGVGTLTGHSLRFHKISRLDGSAKCDVKETGKPDDIIYGVVFVIDVVEKPVLDQIEGLGLGYEQKQVRVEMHDGKRLSAFTYYATLTDASLKPFDWYKAHVVIGAREHDLPAEYIRHIEAIPSVADTDIERQRTELAIYT
jgi:gamma-glutamylcyclotransferase